jgi:hypothetical protein
MSDNKLETALEAQRATTDGRGSVHVKLAPFWPTKPVGWFAQAEEIFAIRGVLGRTAAAMLEFCPRGKERSRSRPFSNRGYPGS